MLSRDPKHSRPTSSHQNQKPTNLSSPTAKNLLHHHPLPKTKEERFEQEFFAICKNLLGLTLGDPEFDEITLDAPRGQVLRQEDGLHLLNSKLNKLVEIFQREENEVKLLEEQCEDLKETVAQKTKSYEESIDAARQQLQDQLEKHGQLVQEKEQGRVQSQNIGRELQAKEEAILELNKNIQQLMADFLAARDRNDRVEEKLARIKEARKAEEEELRGPRPGSQEYEEKMNIIWTLERALKEEEEANRVLEEENDHLKQQLKELAPHSVLSPDDKSPQKAGSLVDLEKYADMKPADIHQDIENMRAQASRQQEIINQLEAQNKDDINAISAQKMRIEDMRAEYVKYMDRFNKAQREREEAMERKNEMEDEGSVILQRFNNVSVLLGKDISPGGLGGDFGEFGSGNKQRFSTNTKQGQQYQLRGEVFGSRAENRDAYVPTPSTLKVAPSRGITKENAGF